MRESAINYNIADLYAFVKQYDKDFTAAQEAPSCFWMQKVLVCKQFASIKRICKPKRRRTYKKLCSER